MSDQAVVETLAGLTRAAGVRGAMLVDVEAGIPVLSELGSGVQETALAAMAGALFNRLADAARGSGYGAVRVAHLEAELGHVIMAGAGALLVVVLTEPDAPLGLVRAQAKRAAMEVRG